MSTQTNVKTKQKENNVLTRESILNKVLSLLLFYGGFMQQYAYDGPVMEFNTCVSHRWKASTYAPSENKARSNLAYQFKKENHKSPNTMITLPGKLGVVQRKENE